MEQVNKKWGNMSKDPGLEAPLGGLCSILFTQEYNKNTCIEVFLYHRVGYQLNPSYT